MAVLPFHDKIEHLVEYGVFGALLLFALRRGPPTGRGRPHALDPPLAATIAAAYAFTDELHQSFVPMRQADPLDLLTDVVGACLFAFALSRYIRPGQAAADAAPLDEGARDERPLP